ncbi:hypothetical protein BGZ94_004118 [Podila epigama]|nr:hypothetical protein BGZ94_004118 [Podila epigama]
MSLPGPSRWRSVGPHWTSVRPEIPVTGSGSGSGSGTPTQRMHMHSSHYHSNILSDLHRYPPTHFDQPTNQYTPVTITTDETTPSITTTTTANTTNTKEEHTLEHSNNTQPPFLEPSQHPHELQSTPGKTIRSWYPTFGPAITTSCSDNTILLDNPNQYQYALATNAKANRQSVGPHWRSIPPASAVYSPTMLSPRTSPRLSARPIFSQHLPGPHQQQQSPTLSQSQKHSQSQLQLQSQVVQTQSQGQEQISTLATLTATCPPIPPTQFHTPSKSLSLQWPFNRNPNNNTGLSTSTSTSTSTSPNTITGIHTNTSTDIRTDICSGTNTGINTPSSTGTSTSTSTKRKAVTQDDSDDDNDIGDDTRTVFQGQIYGATIYSPPSPLTSHSSPRPCLLHEFFSPYTSTTQSDQTSRVHQLGHDIEQESPLMSPPLSAGACYSTQSLSSVEISSLVDMEMSDSMEGVEEEGFGGGAIWSGGVVLGKSMGMIKRAKPRLELELDAREAAIEFERLQSGQRVHNLMQECFYNAASR